VACDVSPRRFPEARERFAEAEAKDAILFLDRWTRDMLVSIFDASELTTMMHQGCVK